MSALSYDISFIEQEPPEYHVYVAHLLIPMGLATQAAFQSCANPKLCSMLALLLALPCFRRLAELRCLHPDEQVTGNRLWLAVIVKTLSEFQAPSPCPEGQSTVGGSLNKLVASLEVGKQKAFRIGAACHIPASSRLSKGAF